VTFTLQRNKKKIFLPELNKDWKQKNKTFISNLHLNYFSDMKLPDKKLKLNE
jgi:hypothetical protein